MARAATSTPASARIPAEAGGDLKTYTFSIGAPTSSSAITVSTLTIVRSPSVSTGAMSPNGSRWSSPWVNEVSPATTTEIGGNGARVVVVVGATVVGGVVATVVATGSGGGVVGLVDVPAVPSPHPPTTRASAISGEARRIPGG